MNTDPGDFAMFVCFLFRFFKINNVVQHEEITQVPENDLNTTNTFSDHQTTVSIHTYLA